MAWWTGQPVYGSNPVSKFIRENFAYLKQYVDYIVNSGVTTADLAAVHALPPSLASVVNITVNTIIGDTDVSLGGGYNISPGITLTINGDFSAPVTQVFFGTGNVVWAAGSGIDVHPEWWRDNAIPGTTDMTTAIQAAADSLGGNVRFSASTYRTTAPINISGPNACSLYGVGRRYTIGLRSKIYIDHAGTGIYVYHQAGLGVQIEGFEIERSAGFAGQGSNVFFDGQRTAGGSGSYIVSSCGMRDILLDGGANGLRLRGAVACSYEYISIISATVGVLFDGTNTANGGIDYPANNVINFFQLNIQVCGTGISFIGQNAGRNIFFLETDLESNTVCAINIVAGILLANVCFDGIWLEDYAAAPLILAGGDHIYFRRMRYAVNVPLVDPATYAATNVHIDGNQGATQPGTLGASNIDVYNYIANGVANLTVCTENDSYAHGIRVAGTSTAGHLMGESVSGIVNQSGVLTKNYLVNWNIAGSSAWDKALVTDAVQSETDPFGGTTAYSFTGFLYGADVFGGGGLDTVAGSTLEYVCWVKGTGSLQLSDSTIGKIMLYFVDTPYWQRVVMRTTRVAGQATGDGINITLTPDTAHSLHIWRPGIYAEFNSIDSRPSAISGAYEGADIGYAEYNYIGARERNSIIVYGAAAPTTGTWAVGDKVINTVPASLGYSGWVCTTAGLIGAGAVFSGYGAIA